MTNRLIFSVLVSFAVLSGESYEIRPLVNVSNSVTTLQFVSAPLGMQSLMCLGYNLAIFNNSGQSIDSIWGKPTGEFTLASQHGKTQIWAKNWAKAGPAELSFDEDGRLFAFRREADDALKDRDAHVVAPQGRVSLRHYWQKTSSGGNETVESDFWHDTNRLRLAYKNPNAAGTLFAELAVLALAGLVFLRPILVRALFGGGMAAFLIMLFFTESRGSFLGFILGAFILVGISLVRRFTLKRLLACCVVVLLGASLCVFGLFGDRFGKNLLEVNESNMLRIQCWRAAPAMMASAPGGWGENCGHSYCDWFQPETNYHPQRWLFNSHLTWMVEHGWAFRFVYCFGWLLLLTYLCFISRRSRLAGCALAVWLAFAVALWFSTVGHCWTLWIAPIAVFAATVPHWLHRREGAGVSFKHTRLVGIAAASSLAISAVACVTIGICGNTMIAKKSLKIHHADGVTTVGDGVPKIWMLKDDLVMSLGMVGAFGRELRSFMQRHPGLGSVAVTSDVLKIPAEVDTLVASGEKAREYQKLWLSRQKEKKNSAKDKRVVFISPSFQAWQVLPTFIKKTDLLFLSGELMKGLYIRPVDAMPRWARFVPKSGLYVPGWMDIALKEEERK